MVIRFNQIWHQMRHAVASQLRSALSAHATELQVARKSDRAGNAYFEIYDPTTGKSSAFGSESEIRVWLDQQHY